MKCAHLALVLIFAAFTTPLIAATVVPEPSLPADFGVSPDWSRTWGDSCTKLDGTLVERISFAKPGGLPYFTHVAVQGNMIALGDEATVTVKQPNGTWLRYDREVETGAAMSDIENVIGMSLHEYLTCSGGQ